MALAAKDLLGHLLEVDPDRRYTAKQAREHSWLRSIERATPMNDEEKNVVPPADHDAKSFESELLAVSTNTV